MKVLVIVALCLIVQIGSKKGGKGGKHMNSECMTSAGVDKETVKAAYSNCSFTGDKLGSFALCMLKKKGVLGDGGTTNEQALKDKVGKMGNSTEADMILKKCLAITGSEREKAGPLAGCICQLYKLKRGGSKKTK